MSERPSGRRRDREEAPTRYTLAPLLEAQVFTAGPGRLTCGVGGRDYSADLGEGGEIFFEGHTFKSPSAFSVYVKRKVNPSRKADDGWTSVKYNGELLSVYRPKLEELISLGIGGSRTPLGPSLSAPSPRASPLRSTQPRRKRRRRDEESETSEEWDEDMNDLEASDEEYKSTHRAAASRDSRGGRRGNRRGVEVARTVRDYISNDQQLAELEDGADNKLMDQDDGVRHLSQCTRAPLSACTPQEFEEDLYTFLSSRKENELVKHLRNKRITCNNTPIDIFGLYREVVRHGGFVDNERYDDYNRWIGGINFAGQIFPKMSNYTPNNRATSIGNQLLSNYRKFLLAYEIAHRAKDLDVPEPSTTQQAASGLEFLANIASGEASGDIVDDLDTNKIPRGHRSRGPRMKREDEEEPESALKEKKRKAPEAIPRNSGRRILAALRKVETSTSRHPPGTLLLAQDPVDLNRHWPVLVAACNDLPRHVASGGCTAHPISDSFPQTLREAVPAARPEEAYPVCIFGSQVVGWVEASSCRPFNLSAGESALAFVRPDGTKRVTGGHSTALNQQCARALKLATQYVVTSDPLQMTARAMVTAAGTKHTAQRLLVAEGKIPSHVLCSNHFQYWQHWRRSVEVAQAPAELSPLIIALAHQINPDMFTTNARETLWEDMRYLLDMELPQASGIQSNGISVLSADDAVSALEESLDWLRILRVNALAGPTGSGLRLQAQAAGSPVLQQMKPGSRNGLKAELAPNLKNCASNTDLAQFAAAAARAQHGPSPLGPPFRGDEPGTKADDDRVSGLQMPTNMEPLGPTPQEVNRMEKEAQVDVDSTGSADGQGSARGQPQGAAPQATQISARQPSPDEGSHPPVLQGFQQYKPPVPFAGQGVPLAGQQL